MKQILLIPIIWFSCFGCGICQEVFEVRTLAFYNLENLFDTVNDTTHYDDDRTANGSARWTMERNLHKLENLAKVISNLGSTNRSAHPEILGVCEVENQDVLQELIGQPLLRTANYAFIHADSPDERGIDVALIYDQDHFIPTSYHFQEVLLYDERFHRDKTRDQLVVVGYLDGEEMGYIVNHWPSRRGGTQKSEANRIRAALITRQLLDSLRRQHPEMPVIVMGDFNDNPHNKSIKQVLQTHAIKDSVGEYQLFNPMENLYAKGYGTIGYRDRWSLFDQFLLNKYAVRKRPGRFSFWKSGIYAPPYLVQSTGRFKGYPDSTYMAGKYRGGYSDHFPVYIHLIRQVD